MAFIKQRWKKMLFVLAVIVVSCLIVAADNMSVTFVYEDKSADGREAVLYFDYGEGFSETDSASSTIRNGKVTFYLTDYQNIKGLRFAAVRVNDTFEGLRTAVSCHVTEGRLIFQGGVIRKFSEEQLIDCLTDDPGSYPVADKLAMTDNFDSPYFAFSTEIISGGSHIAKVFFFFRNLIGNILILLIPMAVFYIAQQYLKKKAPKTKWAPAIVAAALGLCPLLLWLLSPVLNIPLMVFILSVVMLIVGMYHSRAPHEKNIYMIMSIFFGPYFMQRARIVINQTGDARLNMFVGYLILVYGIAVYSLFEWKSHTKEQIIELKTRKLINGEIQLDIVCSTFAKVFIIYFVFNLIRTLFVDGGISAPRALTYCFSAVGLLNLSWFFTIMLFVMLFVGTGISGLIFGLYGIIYTIGDFVKMYYADTLLMPRDLQQIPDMFRIMSSTIPKWKSALVVIVLVGLVVWLIFSLKRAGRYMKPAFHFVAGVLAFIPAMLFTQAVLGGDFKADYDIGYTTLLSQYESEEINGKYFYDFFNVVNMNSNTVSMPADYSREHMQELKEKFASYSNYNEAEDVKPNVIFIMAESFFSMDNIDTLTFTSAINPTADKYANGTAISSSYGGSTAAIEYEALTGHSMYFYQQGTIPYTAFLSKPFNSIVEEFNQNGYETIAIHPNSASFYNRDKAYSLMNFDTFYSNDNMNVSPSELTPGGYMKDEVFAQRVINLMEESEGPTFLFGVSIASHYTAANHVDKPYVSVKGADLVENDCRIIEQQASAFMDTDRMLQTLIDYVDSCKEPTILYLFGDHLPPLPNWSKIGWIDEGCNRYSTILVGYSNYKTIEFPEYLSPNFLGVSLIMDAGIKHNSYWDYLYHLRDVMPIMNRNVAGEITVPEIDDYNNIQYDIMFGQRFLLQD
ncbi:MAG: LTA synthase family protein [Eubacterium sp.]|nr:LTA synthase family protein [Eubacterium sp.]